MPLSFHSQYVTLKQEQQEARLASIARETGKPPLTPLYVSGGVIGGFGAHWLLSSLPLPFPPCHMWLGTPKIACIARAHRHSPSTPRLLVGSKTGSPPWRSVWGWASDGGRPDPAALWECPVGMEGCLAACAPVRRTDR